MKTDWEARFAHYKRLSHAKTQATNNVYAWYDALRQCLGEYTGVDLSASSTIINLLTSSLPIINRLPIGHMNVNGGRQVAKLLEKELKQISRFSAAREWIDRRDNPTAKIELLAAEVADALGDEALDPNGGLYAILKAAEEATGKSFLYQFKILGANTSASSSSMQSD